MCQSVAHEVHPATLPSGLQNLGDGGLDALVAVADDQLDPTQAAAVEAAQKLRPERLCLTGADFEAQHLSLPLGVDPHSDYYGHAHDTPGLPGFDIGRVDPEVGPVAFDLAVQESPHTFIELTAYSGHRDR